MRAFLKNRDGQSNSWAKGQHLFLYLLALVFFVFFVTLSFCIILEELHLVFTNHLVLVEPISRRSSFHNN